MHSVKASNDAHLQCIISAVRCLYVLEVPYKKGASCCCERKASLQLAGDIYEALRQIQHLSCACAALSGFLYTAVQHYQ